MRNKSTFVGILILLLSTLGVIVWLILALLGDIPFSKDALWFLCPIAYGGWMLMDNDEDVIKQHLKLFNAIISVFKKKA